MTENIKSSSSRAIALPVSNGDTRACHAARLLSYLGENLSRSNSLHLAFLHGRQLAMRALSSDNTINEISCQLPGSQVPVFSKVQLQEFGTGSIAKCFGPDFSILDTRISPRIPNGDLLVIDRIISISGDHKNLKPPASVTSEFDVPKSVWFLSENDYPSVPLSLLLEIALQPCGILSAYLGTSLVLPAENNQFRNLDGEITFYNNMNLSGKIITNRVSLLDAFTSSGMHIQKYGFELSVNGSVFLAGKSSFGYFSKMAMRNQVGLGNAKTLNNERAHLANIYTRDHRIAKKHLDLVDTVNFSEGSGKYGIGIISGEKQIGENEWFYANHFYQDPVMPGSLGLETIMQGLWTYVKAHRYLDRFAKPVVDFNGEQPFVWKYRGQVLPTNRLVEFTANLKYVEKTVNAVRISADADFSVDKRRIYEFKNISLNIREG